MPCKESPNEEIKGSRVNAEWLVAGKKDETSLEYDPDMLEVMEVWSTRTLLHKQEHKRTVPPGSSTRPRGGGAAGRARLSMAGALDLNVLREYVTSHHEKVSPAPCHAQLRVTPRHSVSR